jgi:hypothetical protein
MIFSGFENLTLTRYQGCGHEFERDEVFITLSLSVRGLQSLQASLESHIRPDLVEAYTVRLAL